MIAELVSSPGAETHSCGAPYLADPDFVLEKPGARAQVAHWYPWMRFIDHATNKGKARAQVERATGEKEGNVRKLYYEHWRKSGRDWRSLVDRAQYPDPQAAVLPAAFEVFVRSISDGLQRDTTGKETYRQLMQRLARWERAPHDPALAIPGYDEPPPRDPFRGHPAGWSERSIRRRLPNRHERALRKQGPKAASNFLPNVHTTRVGLEIGQVLYFDDQDHDTYVNVTGLNPKALRPQSFNGLDALTGFAFDPGLKPQLWDAAAGKVRKLDQLDFFWYVMMVLTRYGYNAEGGTVLIFEHGTANVDKRDQSTAEDHFDTLIQGVTGGKVRVDRSGIWRAPAFRELLFEGKPTGNFRFKAPIESWFNLLRNYSAGLPAPTGRNRDRAPEESHGLLLKNERQLALIDKLPKDRFLALQREVLEWEDYAREHQRIVRAINRRTDHALEGWHRLGFTGQRYRLGLDQPWIAGTQWQMIPAAAREVYRHIVTQPGYFESFLLSPEEAFESRRAQLTRLPIAKIPLLAPPRAWEPITVTQKLELQVRRDMIDRDPLRYIARVRDPRGYEVHLERGKTYLRLLNIFDPSQLWIAEAEGAKKGAYIGVADLLQPSCKLDADGIHAQLGAVAHVRSIERKEAEVRSESQASIRVGMRAHNAAVLGHDLPADRAVRVANERDEARAVQLGHALRRSEPAAAEPAPANVAEDWSDAAPLSEPITSQPTDHIETW